MWRHAVTGSGRKTRPFARTRSAWVSAGLAFVTALGVGVVAVVFRSPASLIGAYVAAELAVTKVMTPGGHRVLALFAVPLFALAVVAAVNGWHDIAPVAWWTLGVTTAGSIAATAADDLIGKWSLDRGPNADGTS